MAHHRPSLGVAPWALGCWGHGTQALCVPLGTGLQWGLEPTSGRLGALTPWTGDPWLFASILLGRHMVVPGPFGQSLLFSAGAVASCVAWGPITYLLLLGLVGVAAIPQSCTQLHCVANSLTHSLTYTQFPQPVRFGCGRARDQGLYGACRTARQWRLKKTNIDVSLSYNEQIKLLWILIRSFDATNPESDRLCKNRKFKGMWSCYPIMNDQEKKIRPPFSKVKGSSFWWGGNNWSCVIIANKLRCVKRGWHMASNQHAADWRYIIENTYNSLQYLQQTHVSTPSKHWNRKPNSLNYIYYNDKLNPSKLFYWSGVIVVGFIPDAHAWIFDQSPAQLRSWKYD